ncbi:Acyl-coenzyme A oxidase 3, peroxisomal [Dichanthelium oligosanthes]|uniref:Acyl-coenzyme A oxidase n=1 Tax=Dichanthelium oligosanthes TaxID=888268 RepID=A0A1E5VL23_9POAL|nr:Acyl-coenzyme A oxidase 3, peroxisomal [Dichanthelium oligosanthes]
MDPALSPAGRRTAAIARHLAGALPASPPLAAAAALLGPSPCLSYAPPESAEPAPAFSPVELRALLDGHHLTERDWVFRVMEESQLFCPRQRGSGSRVFVAPDYNDGKEAQREATMRRVAHLAQRGVFRGWLTEHGADAELCKLALLECLGVYDHSLAIKIGVHFFLCLFNFIMYSRGSAIKFLGTKRHHDKWFLATENYDIKGCFAMTELGHGSNVRGIETIATYDSKAREFIINTPCESAQKYWIGGAANHATHTIVFSQLHINGKNEGVHAFVAQIRDEDGNVLPNIHIADCGHKIGLNGVDNGRIWFQNIRVPRENLLNLVADVLPDGQYVSMIDDPDQRFAAFLSPLTLGRVNIAVNSVYISKECREACGGQGLKTENRVGIFKAEFDVQSTFEGDNNVLMQQVSKALYADFLAAQKKKQPFKGLGLEQLNGPSPVIPDKLTSSILRSSQFQSYQLAEDLARAFTERTILQIFLEDEMNVPSGSLKEVLGLLRSLYVMVSVDESASFLRYGYLSRDNVAGVRKEVSKLCSELRPHALAVASSFGIPDAFLSPLAFDWIAANALSTGSH